MLIQIAVRVVTIRRQIVHTFGQIFASVLRVRFRTGGRCGEIVGRQVASYDLSAQICLVNVTIAARTLRYGIHILMLFGVLFRRGMMIMWLM